MQDRDPSSLENGRTLLLDRLLAVTVWACLLPAVAGTLLGLTTGTYAISVVDTVGWIILLGLSRLRGHFRLRGTALVAILIIVGTVVLYTVGPYGVGLVWMIAAPSLGGLLFARTGLIVSSAALLGALTLVFALVQLDLGSDVWKANPPPMLWWILVYGSALAVSILTTLPGIELVKRLEASLAESAEAQTALAVQAARTQRLYTEFEYVFTRTPQALLLVNESGAVVLHNQAASDLLEASVGDVVTDLVHDLPADADVHGALVRGRRSDGGDFFAEATVIPCIIDERRYQLVGVVDVDLRERAQRELAASIADRDTLLQEVHHRVKNNLQIVSSLLDLQSASLDSAEARDALQESTLRVRSMALVHQQLYSGGNFASIQLDEYLQSLIRQIIAALGREPDLTLDMDRTAQRLDIALPCGLIANELITNALKHGRSADDRCRLTVTLRASQTHLSLVVTDDGPGLPADWLQRRRSLGSQILRALARQLRAELTVDVSSGTTFTLTVPIEEPKRTPLPAGPVQPVA